MQTNCSAQHTPGPWTVEYQYNGRVDIVGPKGPIACTWKTDVAGVDTTNANARLIAAAPALLEALETIVGFLETDKSNDWEAEIEMANDAIAQATGEGQRTVATVSGIDERYHLVEYW